MDTDIYVRCARESLFRYIDIYSRRDLIFLYQVSNGHLFDIFIDWLRSDVYSLDRLLQNYEPLIEQLSRCYEVEDTVEIMLETALSDILFHKEGKVFPPA